eukprot:g1778.t1
MGNSESSEESVSNNPSSSSKSGFHVINVIILAPYSHPASLYLRSQIESLQLDSQNRYVVQQSGDHLQSFKPNLLKDVEVVLNITGSSSLLEELWPYIPNVAWVHTTTSGVDQLLFGQEKHGSRKGKRKHLKGFKKSLVGIEEDEESAHFGKLREISAPEIWTNTYGGGVAITCTRNLYSTALAEFVIAACFYFSKKIHRMIQAHKQKMWDIFQVQMLHSKTLCIIGFGAIGRATARMALSVGMNVFACRKRPTKTTADEAMLCTDGRVHGYDESSMKMLLETADFLLVSVPLTFETVNLIGKREFSLMKSTAILISTSRPPVVNENDLVNALNKGKISGAALDYHYSQPLSQESELFKHSRVLVSSNCGANVPGILKEAINLFLGYAQMWASKKHNRSWIELKDELNEIFVNKERRY